MAKRKSSPRVAFGKWVVSRVAEKLGAMESDTVGETQIRHDDDPIPREMVTWAIRRMCPACERRTMRRRHGTWTPTIPPHDGLEPVVLKNATWYECTVDGCEIQELSWDFHFFVHLAAKRLGYEWSPLRSEQAWPNKRIRQIVG